MRLGVDAVIFTTEWARWMYIIYTQLPNLARRHGSCHRAVPALVQVRRYPGWVGGDHGGGSGASLTLELESATRFQTLIVKNDNGAFSLNPPLFI